jgi:hypothetical protein
LSTPDATRIKAIIMDCLYTEEELDALNGAQPSDAVIVRGVVGHMGFHPQRLASHKDDIREQLEGLPDNFRRDKGGGWSFLNACMSRTDEQWGQHIDIDNLLMLGIATEQARFQLPREVWGVMPGGMPYFSVL